MSNEMVEEVNHRQRITDYLLGRLPEAEQQELAAAYFEDDDLFDQLLEVENDLLDEYARGELETAERAAFADYLNRLPDGRHKVAVATVLGGTEARPQPFLSARSWLAAAAGLAVVLAGIGIYNLQVRRERDRLTAQTTKQEAEKAALQEQLSALTRRTGEEQARAERLQRELDAAQQRETGRAQETPSTTVASLVFPILGALRGGAPDNPLPTVTLLLTSKNDRVNLTVPLRSREDYFSYRALLQTRDGKILWQGDQRPIRSRNQKLTVHLPAKIFEPGDYTLTLMLTAKKDRLELQRDFPFTVVKK